MRRALEIRRRLVALAWLVLLVSALCRQVQAQPQERPAAPEAAAPAVAAQTAKPNLPLGGPGPDAAKPLEAADGTPAPSPVDLAGASAATGAPAASERKSLEAELLPLIGKTIRRIEVVFTDPLWSSRVTLERVRTGQIFTPAVGRRALDELADSRRFGELRAEVEPLQDGVLLRLSVLARRIIAGVRVSGVGDPDTLLRAAGIQSGKEVTARDLASMVRRIEQELARRGYPHARARVEPFDTDDPLETILAFQVTPGAESRVITRRFLVWPDPLGPGMRKLVNSYQLEAGEVADSELAEGADRDLERTLRAYGYVDAQVEHDFHPLAGGVRLDVRVDAGSFVQLRFEGNRLFDAKDFETALAGDPDRSPAHLAERIQEFYVERGLLDATVDTLVRGSEGAPRREVTLRISEGRPVRVAAREYPCLKGERTREQLNSEIDSFLSELPGGTLVGAVDSESLDQVFGPKHFKGRRKPPFSSNPWSVYSPDAYERALEHLEDLYRSEGYLSAEVGPVTVLRGRCDRRSPAGVCLLTPRAAPLPAIGCAPSKTSQWSEAALDPDISCVPDRTRGIRCEPEIRVQIPIRLGPRSFVRSIAIAGNSGVSDAELLVASELRLGAPVSQAGLEHARRRMLEHYAELGFAFSEVEVDLELSKDQKDARVRFVVGERKQVRVSRILVRGAKTTSERVIRRRIALEPGGLYRQSLIRRTEEHLATLGVFSTVTVGLEDPYVPASQKVVLITVQERKPQYLDVRPGFSTGEGFRISFEYGHRNLAGQAIQLTLRSQLGFLPSSLILEDSVRRKYDELDALERLERRNTATLEFPDVGLGPLFRLRVEGVDVRDNARDYGLTKDAAIVSLFFLPERRLWFELGGSLERNDASIFGEQNKQSLDEYIRENASERNAFRVPEGATFVFAQRLGATWDRRDRPLDATSGTFVSAGIEHVTAEPSGQGCPENPEDSVFAPACSRFLRYTSRIAGYLRLSKRGLALAASLRWGVNHQLTRRSRTYPDRLFFLGGVDSLRGFLQEALIPEDVAEQLSNDPALDVNQVVIRGGDVFINPRLELRVPLGNGIQTALFLDSGNLWTDPAAVDLIKLRYTFGSGLRVSTPVGPLVFDYGFNADRVIAALGLSEKPERTWEDLGAFHFSIGLF